MANVRVDSGALYIDSKWCLKAFAGPSTATILTSSHENAIDQARALPAGLYTSQRRPRGHIGDNLQLVLDALSGLSGHVGDTVGSVFGGTGRGGIHSCDPRISSRYRVGDAAVGTFHRTLFWAVHG
jgi:hypothetical protein